MFKDSRGRHRDAADRPIQQRRSVAANGFDCGLGCNFYASQEALATKLDDYVALGRGKESAARAHGPVRTGFGSKRWSWLDGLKPVPGGDLSVQSLAGYVGSWPRAKHNQIDYKRAQLQAGNASFGTIATAHTHPT
eukprot:365786-Chlamydomonas_euryale.AAC.9